MSDILYYALSAALALLVLFGIGLMSQVKTAKYGNGLSALAMFFAVILTIVHYNIFTTLDVILISMVALIIGSAVGTYLSVKVKMIQMPELVALLNGVGGAASALVGGLTLLTLSNTFETTTALLAVIIGLITLFGSLIAAMKLAKLMSGRPVVYTGHSLLTMTALLISVLALVLTSLGVMPLFLGVIVLSVFSILFGYLFSIRIGGADMPITISLLNSLSGVAGAIAGMAINNVLLVAIGGIVGASGLLLTQIMCKAMNRSLLTILLGKTSVQPSKKGSAVAASEPVNVKTQEVDLGSIVKEARKVIIVPGYGMALAQAQHAVKQLQLLFEKQGAEVKYAIHPVAGRMPGHMNVLLAEADVDYDQLIEMDDINPFFKLTDLTVVIGANDVINPAAKTQEGTPIYGMPILNVEESKHVIICNYDNNPGYAGVSNPLYNHLDHVSLLFGDALDTLPQVMALFKDAKEVRKTALTDTLVLAKKVILVPGYGMALSQAQHHVKRLYDAFIKQGAEVSFAIHPVAGRMPGHMNVLLAEANVDYDVLLEMDDVNPKFKEADIVVVIGANDVINPAAKTQVGTPIYGMPILNVDEAKHIIICNFNADPGYAGVDNPLYTQKHNVTLLFGDAKESLDTLLSSLN